MFRRCFFGKNSIHFRYAEIFAFSPARIRTPVTQTTIVISTYHNLHVFLLNGWMNSCQGVVRVSRRSGTGGWWRPQASGAGWWNRSLTQEIILGWIKQSSIYNLDVTTWGPKQPGRGIGVLFHGVGDFAQSALKDFCFFPHGSEASLALVFPLFRLSCKTTFLKLKHEENVVVMAEIAIVTRDVDLQSSVFQRAQGILHIHNKSAVIVLKT